MANHMSECTIYARGRQNERCSNSRDIRDVIGVTWSQNRGAPPKQDCSRLEMQLSSPTE